MLRLAISLMLFVATMAAASAESRVALVLGNSDYAAVPPLRNPANDASDLGAAFSRLGFEVTVALDVGLDEMNRQLGAFARRARDAEMAVVFFAGHGMEVDGTNYLLPSDAMLSHPSDLYYSAMDLDRLIAAVSGAKTLRLVLLDACRDNPFRARFPGDTRTLRRGLARVEPPGGTLVGFAAKGGTVAYDGAARNSPYTSALLEHIEEPGLEIGKLFRRVRDRVYRQTEGAQEPFTYGSLPHEDIYLAAAPAAFAPLPDPILEDFNAALGARSADAYEAFLREHGDRQDRRELVETIRGLLDLAASPPAPASNAFSLPDIRSPQEEETALGLVQEQRARIQGLLPDLGYGPGPADGALGPRTRSALKAFQLDAGLLDTGYVGERTIRELTAAHEAAPRDRDGIWELSIIRKAVRKSDAYGVDYVGRPDLFGTVKFEISGRTVTVLETTNLSQAPDPVDPGIRASLDTRGRLMISLRANYLFFRNDSRRVSASLDLPERVKPGQMFVMPGGAFNSVFVFEGRLRRVTAE